MFARLPDPFTCRLADDKDPQRYRRAAQRIVRHVCAVTGVPVAKAWGRSKFFDHARTRMLAWWMLRELTDATMVEIGAMFGRDHSTISNGVRVVNRSLRQMGWAWRAIDAILEHARLGRHGTQFHYCGPRIVLKDQGVDWVRTQPANGPQEADEGLMGGAAPRARDSVGGVR